MLEEEEISPPPSAKRGNIERVPPKSPPPFNSKNRDNNNNDNDNNNINDENKNKNNNNDNNASAMQHSNKSTTFGKCGTCGENIPTQGEGCTTVGSEVYHTDCFKCAECSEILSGMVYY